MDKLFICFLITVLLFGIQPAQAQDTLYVEGVYRGKDLYIQNPYLNVEGAFCIESVLLNGELIMERPAVSAVKVDLSDLRIDSPVHIAIVHSSACTPRVLNSEVLEPGDSFRFIQTITDAATVSWVTTGEKPGRGEYVVEKWKLAGWQPIARMPAKGNLDTNQYSIAVEHYAGDNLYRIWYIDGKDSVMSEEMSYYSDLEPITFFPEDEVDDVISLSRPTDYQIKDFDGTVLLEGYGQDINVEALPYGEYILVIENREENFYKPEPEIILPPKKTGKKKKNGPH